MIVGKLGEIIFEVSDDVVQTLDNMSWSGSVRYATHQRHLYHAKTEYTGMNPDQIQFDITLSAYLGVNPQTAIGKIWKYERDGEPVPLAIGHKGYGKYRWTITKHNIKMKHFDGEGDLTHCVVSVSLQEYIYS